MNTCVWLSQQTRGWTDSQLPINCNASIICSVICDLLSSTGHSTIFLTKTLPSELALQKQKNKKKCQELLESSYIFRAISNKYNTKPCQEVNIFRKEDHVSHPLQAPFGVKFSYKLRNAELEIRVHV